MATASEDVDLNIPLVAYPKNIRGSLRITLQIKDLFILAFNMVESYRNSLLACQKGFTRNLAIYNLSVGLNSINQLRSEIEEVRAKVEAKANRNRALRHHIKTKCKEGVHIEARLCNLVNRMRLHTQKLQRKNGQIVGCVDKLAKQCDGVSPVEAALHGGLEIDSAEDVDVDKLDVPPEVDLSKDSSQSGRALLPVVDFYRGFFFLQMHFQLAMCLTANHSMPLITQPLSLGRRLKGWPTNLGKPTGKKKKSQGKLNGGIGDRLEDIHDELICLLERLRHCMKRVDEKALQDKVIERYYRKHCAAHERIRRCLLRCLQSQRQLGERLDEQNDHLTGILVKSDPNFTRLEKFHDFTGDEGIFELVDDSITKSFTLESNLSPLLADDTDKEDLEAEEGDEEKTDKRSSMIRESATQTLRQMNDPQIDILLMGAEPGATSTPKTTPPKPRSSQRSNPDPSLIPDEPLKLEENTLKADEEEEGERPGTHDQNQSSSAGDPRLVSKRYSLLRGMKSDKGEPYLNLPDTNDNHGLQFSTLPRAEDDFSPSSWQEISDMSSCRPVSISAESANCLLPGWAKDLLKNSKNEDNEEESETEEELRNDDRRTLSSAKLEKRQILVEAILQADSQRLEEILSTLLKPSM